MENPSFTAAQSGTITPARYDALVQAAAVRIAANKYTLLKEMVRLGMLRLVVTDGTADGVVEVVPSPFTGTPPVMRGVGDFERLGGTHVSYYWVEESGGSPRPTMVFELTYGRWAQVSAPSRLGWGIAELSAFAAAGHRTPYLRFHIPLFSVSVRILHLTISSLHHPHLNSLRPFCTCSSTSPAP